jgi:nucleoside-diphosphate-sugar epimerase
LLNQNQNIILIKRSYSNIWRIEEIINNSSNLKLIDLDTIDIAEIFTQYPIKGILHLATYYTKFHKSNDIQDMINSNITFPTNLLENAVNNNTEFFINTGSFSEYSLKNIPIDENTQISPFNLYSSTKIAFESILKYYNKEYDINTSTLKIFTPYGPKDDENKIIPHIIINILKRNKVTLQSTSKKLDPIFVSDIIDAYNNLIKYINKFSKNENFNIANGTSHSIKEIYSIVESKLGKTEVEFLESDLSEVTANIKKSNDLLHWNPKINLETGLELTIDYYKRKYG